MRDALKTERAYHVEAVHSYGLDLNSRTIFVDVETEGCVDSVMAQKFIKNLHLLENTLDDITVVIITCGGEWYYGMAMYDAIKNSRCRITTVSYAHARSMSSIIPQAADERVITPTAVFMSHNGTDYFDGVTEGVQVFAQQSKIATDQMLQIYADRCVDGEFFKEREMSVAQTKNYIKKKINQKLDWYLSAEEAIYYGFMDRLGRG